MAQAPRARSWPALLAGFVVGLLVLPAAAVLVLVSGAAPADAVSPPPAWESFIGQAALNTSLAHRAERLRSPIADGDAAALAAGLKLYRANCAGCHGDYRRPSPWGSRAFYPRAPQFGVEAPSITAPEAFVVLRDGVRYSGMGAWRDLLRDADRWRLAGFVSQVGRLPAEVDREWKTGPPGAGSKACAA